MNYIPGYQKTDFPVAVRPEYIEPLEPPNKVPRAPYVDLYPCVMDPPACWRREQLMETEFVKTWDIVPTNQIHSYFRYHPSRL